MRAVVYDHTGTARDVLRVVDVERPEPGQGEVRVRVAVSGVNPTDVKARSGVVPRPIDGFQIPHQDGAGEIDAIGHGVEQSRLGERVWVWFAAAGRRWGTAAEWTVVPEHQAVPLPATVSPELGASLDVPAMTACHCLFADGPPRGGTVLVAGGAGAVGHFAIELARWAGARVVSTVSGLEQAALATRAGAQHVVNYKDPDAIDQIRSFAAQVDCNSGRLARHPDLTEQHVDDGFFGHERHRAEAGVLLYAVGGALGVLGLPPIGLAIFVILPIYHGVTSHGLSEAPRVIRRITPGRT